MNEATVCVCVCALLLSSKWMFDGCMHGSFSLFSGFSVVRRDTKKTKTNWMSTQAVIKFLSNGKVKSAAFEMDVFAIFFHTHTHNFWLRDNLRKETTKEKVYRWRGRQTIGDGHYFCCCYFNKLYGYVYSESFRLNSIVMSYLSSTGMITYSFLFCYNFIVLFVSFCHYRLIHQLMCCSCIVFTFGIVNRCVEM